MSANADRAPSWRSRLVLLLPATVFGILAVALY